MKHIAHRNFLIYKRVQRAMRIDCSTSNSIYIADTLHLFIQGRYSSMAKALFILFVLLAGVSLGQPITASESKNQRVEFGRMKDGYQTAVPGWVIHEGDTLTFGKGTMPTKQFAFIYLNPTSFAAPRINGHLIMQYMESDYTGKRGIVKTLVQNGTQRQGFTMCAILGVGRPTRYYVELDNAIEAGEIVPPPGFQRPSTTSPTFSVADELIKLKSLMDSGVLTKDEFDAQKKKLLSQ